MNAEGLFLDVSKIVRPYLKAKLGVRKWSLTFAVKTCLERGQSDAHSAVSDSIDTLDLMVKMKDEKAPEKAFRESDYVQNMCARIAQGLPIEEPTNESKNKLTKPASDPKAVDKKQPLMVAFFKVIPNQKKAVTDDIEKKGVSVDEIDKDVKNKENFIVKTGKLVNGKRKSNVLEEISKTSYEFGSETNQSKRNRTRRVANVLEEVTETRHQLSNGGLHISTRSKRRRIETVVESNESNQPFGQTKERKRAPRAPRAPRSPREPRKRKLARLPRVFLAPGSDI